MVGGGGGEEVNVSLLEVDSQGMNMIRAGVLSACAFLGIICHACHH
jgi:hypothetical protein